MPRPKGAGQADPRLGRVSSRILDQILDEYDSGQRERLIRRIRRLQSRALRSALKDGGCETFAPNGMPGGPPPALVMAQVAAQVAQAEEIISRIREREQGIDAKAMTLFAALHSGGAEEEERGPRQIVVKYATGVEPQHGDSAQPAAEPGASGSGTGQ